MPIEPDARDTAREPMFMVPGVVVGFVALLALIHILRQFLNPDLDILLIFGFGFVPLRYAGIPLDFAFPFEPYGAWLAPLTYSLLHDGWLHLIANSFWLIAFGTPLARRFGTGRFLILSLVCAVAGAATHLLTHWAEPVPVIGASGVVSGLMAAALWFAFSAGGPLSRIGQVDAIAASRMPASTLGEVMSNARALSFAGFFIAINLVIAALGDAGVGGTIAWQAHLGGFLAGFALFRVIDPIPTRREIGGGSDNTPFG